MEKTIEQLLLEEHSKEQKLMIADWVGESKSRMAQLMKCFFSKELQLCQRASWPLIDICLRSPSLLKPYHKKMVENLDTPMHDAIVRNTLRVFEEVDFPESIEGELLEKCFVYISNPKKAIAIRAFAITLAYKICKNYPELMDELKVVIEEFIPYENSAAIKFRMKKVMKLMAKS